MGSKIHDLWKSPTLEVHNSRTSRHSEHASLVWQIWLAENTKRLLSTCSKNSTHPEVSEVPILGVEPKAWKGGGRLGMGMDLPKICVLFLKKNSVFYILDAVTIMNGLFSQIYVPVNSKTAHPPPPWANPGAFDFFEKFWSNSPLCRQLDGQMPHPLELQRGSNPPPSRHVKAAVETSSAKF